MNHRGPTRTDRAETGRRLAFIDAYAFPGSVTQRLVAHQPQLQDGQLALVEDAGRQWFRMLARDPGETLAMPSLVADELWHELVLHTRDYADFCDAAFGRFLHHQPESAMTEQDAAANQTSGLVRALAAARADEGRGPGDLPLLFRVDAAVGAAGGRRYLATCGGESECYPVPGLTCLRHLAGVPASRRRRFWHARSDQPGQQYSNHPAGGSDGGVGCGGGCGGA